jgi:hypothetical protein
MDKPLGFNLDLQLFANVTGSGTIGTVWNLPNYSGMLFTSDVVEFPLTNLIGGVQGAAQTNNFEFPIGQSYSHEAASQPAISETASLAAPDAIEYTRDQESNVTQIFQEKVSISYVKMSNPGRLEGLNSAGQVANPISDADFQKAMAFEKIARDLEYTEINGVYQKSINSGVANKTRGLLAAATTATNAASAYLTKEMVDTHLRAMFAAGSKFKRPVFLGGAFQVEKLNDIYGNVPADWNIGGVRLSVIRTIYGDMGVLAPHRFMPTTQLLLADLAVVQLVFQPTPPKGNLFYEVLSKTGAAESGQIFGQIGLNHGPGFAHGRIYGLLDA